MSAAPCLGATRCHRTTSQPVPVTTPAAHDAAVKLHQRTTLPTRVFFLASFGRHSAVWFDRLVVGVQGILTRVGELIDSGRQLDEVPGLAGIALDGEGIFRGDRRVYHRGTDEYAQAAADGILDRLPPPPPPATPEVIHEAESQVGTALPPLLRALYSIANGGFGPGYGLLGLQGGFADDMGRTAVDILSEVPKGLWPGMPPELFPLCHWGCAIYSFVHCPSGRVFGWDPNPVEPEDDVPFFEQEYLLDSWFEAWLDGTLQQPWVTFDPTTRIYRGATIEETRAAMSEGGD